MNNIIAVPSGSGSVHSQISAHYSSKFDYTNDKTVRDWLATHSFEQQFEYGKNLLSKFGSVTAIKMNVLHELSKKMGALAFTAEQTLKRWNSLQVN